jgi:hypothetical protein
VLVAAEAGEKMPGFTFPADDWGNRVLLEEHAMEAVLEDLDKAL